MKKVMHKHHIAVIAFAAIIGVSALTASVYQRALPNHRQDVRPDKSVLGSATEANRYAITASDLSIGDTNQTTQTKHVSLKVTVNNTGNESLQISPGMQMQLSDSTGAISFATAKYLPTDTVLGGPVPSSSISIMKVDFEIAGNAQPKQFIFQPDLKSKPSTIGL